MTGRWVGAWWEYGCAKCGAVMASIRLVDTVCHQCSGDYGRGKRDAPPPVMPVFLRAEGIVTKRRVA